MPEGRGGRSKLAETFARLRASNRRAFIPYITAGHPSPELTPEILDMLADEGCDAIELGLPFSDPLADGPVIQAATWKALGLGVDVSQTLEWSERFAARRSTPLVLFSYLNPILHYGPERFVRDAEHCGAAGILITDLPVGEDDELEARLAAGQPDLVRLIAPTTLPDRVARVVRSAQGFIYYISRTGVTGESERLRQELSREVEAIRSHTDLPVVVGFGISNAEQARAVASVSDGVVVGSALVRTLETAGIAAGREFVRMMREAIDDTTS